MSLAELHEALQSRDVNAFRAYLRHVDNVRNILNDAFHIETITDDILSFACIIDEHFLVQYGGGGKSNYLIHIILALSDFRSEIQRFHFTTRFHISLFGNQCVGKYSLIQRLKSGKNPDKLIWRPSGTHEITLNTNYGKIILDIPYSSYEDNTSQSRIKRAYTNAAIILVSVDSRVSYKNARMWKQFLSYRMNDAPFPIILCENKIDLPRKIPKKLLEKLLESWELRELPFAQISVKDNINVKGPFEMILKMLIAKDLEIF